MNNNQSDEAVLKRILAHFEKIAPRIVNESVRGLSTEQSIIDYYDSDFYLGKMEGAFDDIDENRLRRIVFENIEEINGIFYKQDKSAGKKS
jgi:hypothetical protein